MSITGEILGEMPGATGVGTSRAIELRISDLQHGHETEGVGSTVVYQGNIGDLQHRHELESPGEIILQLFPQDLEHGSEMEDVQVTVTYDGDVADLEHRNEAEPVTVTITYDGVPQDLEHGHELEEVTGLIIPARPENFEAERKNSFTDTDLTWDAVPEATEYVISRAEHYRERYVELARVQSGTTTYTDNHGNADQRYSYRIYAVHRNGGVSARSPAVHTKSQSGER